MAVADNAVWDNENATVKQGYFKEPETTSAPKITEENASMHVLDKPNYGRLSAFYCNEII